MNVSFEDFLDLIATWKAEFRACPDCFDPEFTAVILAMLEGLGLMSLQQQQEQYKFVQDLMIDLSIWAQLGSSGVECKNGHIQRFTHQWRGGQRDAFRKSEESYLQCVNKAHANVVEAAKPWFFPRTANLITRSVKRNAVNQYTPPAKRIQYKEQFTVSSTVKATYDANLSQAQSSCTRKRRELSGCPVLLNALFVFGI